MKKYRKLIVGIVMIVIASFICGGIVGYLVGADCNKGQVSLRETRDRILRQVVKELKLTPEQQADAARILEASLKRMVKFRIKHAPEILMIIKENNEEFRAILNPEQQKIYDDYRQQKVEEIKEKLMAGY